MRCLGGCAVGMTPRPVTFYSMLTVTVTAAEAMHMTVGLADMKHTFAEVLCNTCTSI